MDSIIHQPALSLVRRIVGFPLSLLVIEFAVVVLVGGAFTWLAHRFIAKTDGAAYFAGALVLAIILVLVWKALQR